MESDEEMEDVKGYIFTHWDCPNCDEVNQEEGHVADEEAVCQNCEHKVKVTT